MLKNHVFIVIGYCNFTFDSYFIFCQCGHQLAELNIHISNDILLSLRLCASLRPLMPPLMPWRGGGRPWARWQWSARTHLASLSTACWCPTCLRLSGWWNEVLTIYWLAFISFMVSLFCIFLKMSKFCDPLYVLFPLKFFSIFVLVLIMKPLKFKFCNWMQGRTCKTGEKCRNRCNSLKEKDKC